MTILLNNGTTPENLPIKTFGFAPQLYIGDEVLSYRELFQAVFAQLQGQSLVAGDPRPQFVKGVSGMRLVDGYNRGGKRLQSSEGIFCPDHELCGVVLSYRDLLKQMLISHKAHRVPGDNARVAVDMWKVMSQEDAEQATDYQISLEDLLSTTDYVLTNSDIENIDDRPQFVKSVQSGTLRDGRLQFPVHPVLSESN